MSLVNENGDSYSALARVSRLNRDGSTVNNNTVSSEPAERFSLDLSYKKNTRFGSVKLGLGYVSNETTLSDQTDNDMRGYIQWSSGF